MKHLLGSANGADGRNSDQNKKGRKDDYNSDDPFNFFKLSSEPSDGRGGGSGKRPRPFWGILLAFAAVFICLNMLLMPRSDDYIDFSEFKARIENGSITYVELNDSYFVGYPKKPKEEDSARQRGLFFLMGRRQQPVNSVRTTGIYIDSFFELLDEKGVDYKFASRSNGFFLQLILNLLPILIIVGIYVFMFRKMGGGLGGGMGSVFGIGGSRAKAVDEGKVKTRFSDVAGVDEAKDELVEVVDFLKEPKKYTDIGGKIPKGVLLVGPPGTGKTLLARAVAGEAGVPFFRISGSDFVEMFVGVGASRVRDLFKQAREKAPCIIFIDELDAIGKSRVNNLGGNDEREQTLNQLLVEMDGFDNEKGLILLAATNRPDVLDPALLRPGRFDRQVVVDRPDVKGREAILRIHSKNVKLDDNVNFESLAHATSGFAGAELANVVNEAALLAVRGGRKRVTMADFDEAIEKSLVGLQKKSKVVKENERNIVAYHETGHALVAAFTKDSAPVHKISIIPRGVGALGYTLQRSEDESFLKTRRELLGEIDVLLGGRAAEQIVFGEVSTGASNDIQRATDIMRQMITAYGMSERFKNVTLGKSGKGYAAEPELVREYSESTQQYIDEEISRGVNERYDAVIELLSQKKELLEVIAKMLLEKETMSGEEFNRIVGEAKRCEEMMNSNAEKVIAEKAQSEGQEGIPNPAEGDAEIQSEIPGSGAEA